MDWFKKRQYTVIKNIPKSVVSSTGPNAIDGESGLWESCPNCNEKILKENLSKNYWVCTHCSYNHRIHARDRIQMMTDSDSFFELFNNVRSSDHLGFPGYNKKLELEDAKDDAIITGTATINGNNIAIGAMNFGFMGGSMGSVVGERICRLFEIAMERNFPVVIATLSGGARMQEGIMSLMQMAKTSSVIAEFRNKSRRPYIALLCDPTTGGTAASFAMLGDFIIGEPGALIGFAGPRVIEQTIRQKLPAGFQRSEFLLDHGFLDMVIHRKDLKDTLTKLITWL